MQSKRSKPIVVVGNQSVSVARRSTQGHGNNCLGYALRGALLVSPQTLRQELVKHIEGAPPDVKHLLATSVIESCEDMPPSTLIESAIAELSSNCFIPADVFVNFVRDGNTRGIVKRANFVFLSELEEGNVYVPVFCHWEDRRRLATHYIGCNNDNTHYSTIIVDDGEALNELLGE